MQGVNAFPGAAAWPQASLQPARMGAMAAAAADGDLLAHLEELAADGGLRGFLDQTGDAIALAEADPTFAEQLDPLLGRIADRIPAKWAEGRTPVMIYPNPLNPKHYVVLNSGFTFREADYLNNAQQIPRLPDWAYIGTDGKVAEAGFFDENWK